MPEITATSLLETPIVTIRDVSCPGSRRGPDAEEHARAAHLVFPYRGIFVRHLGGDEAVGEANQELVFNPGERYRVSRPVAGGDSSLRLVLSEAVLADLTTGALRGC